MEVLEYLILFNELLKTTIDYFFKDCSHIKG